jgi:hypothetical protein
MVAALQNPTDRPPGANEELNQKLVFERVLVGSWGVQRETDAGKYLYIIIMLNF